MKKILLKLFSGILCILLTLSLFITLISMVIGFNLNIKSVNRYILSSGYINMIYDKILEKIYNYADINNLPHEIFGVLAKNEFMTSDIYEYMISMNSEEISNKYIIDINKKEEILKTEIKRYVLDNMTLTEAQRTNIDKNIESFVQECMTIYKNNIKSSMLEKSSKYIKFIDKYHILVYMVLILIDLLIFYTLINIQKWKHRGYRYSLYSVLGAELMMLMIAGYLLFCNIIDRVTVVSKELNSLVTEVLNGMLVSVYISILVLAMLILIDMYFYVKKKEKVVGLH